MLKINLGCSDQYIDGFIGVDRWTPQWATDDNFIKADLSSVPWPFADNSADHIRAHDIIEHLALKIVTLNEIHRILKPGGTVEIVVPTTEGRGADQDPTHCSYWNRNSFFYHTVGDPHYNRFHQAYGINGAFIVKSENQSAVGDCVYKLEITLAAYKGESLLKRTCAICGKSDLALSEGFACLGELAFCKSHTQVECREHEKKQTEQTEETKVKTGDFDFSILHTSARPNEWKKVYEAWLNSAAHPERVEYILCIDGRWGYAPPTPASELVGAETPHRKALGFDLRPQDKVIWNTGRRCYVDGVNLAAEASSGAVLIVNADDQYPCDRWDEAIENILAIPESANSAVKKFFAHGDDFVIEVTTNTPTEHERGILVMPIPSRERYERFGWVLYPGYEGVYADNDFCAMAKRDNCIIDARHLVFPHKHWINGQREKDEQDKAQNRDEAYNEGRKLFAARKRINFAGVPPTVETTQEIDAKIPMVAICTPGNVFSMAWVDAWTKLWSHITMCGKYNATHVMVYTSNAGMVRQKIMDALLTTDYGVPVDYVLWIDDDNTVTPEQFEMLMADLAAHREYDAVAGWTWCGSDDFADVGTATVSCGQVKMLERTDDGRDVKFCRVKQISPRELVESPTDLIEIQYSGFPAVLMRTELLRKAGKHPFAPFVDERCEYGFSGEDLAFFVRANIRSGARYAVDRRVFVPHYKRRAIEPKLTPAQMVEAGRKMESLAAK